MDGPAFGQRPLANSHSSQPGHSRVIDLPMPRRVTYAPPMRWPRLLLIALSLVGCATTKVAQPAPVVAAAPVPVVEPPRPPPSPAPYQRPDIVALRDEARSLVRQQSDLYWRNWAFGEPIDIAETYKGHDTLFSAQTFRLIQSARVAAHAEALGRMPGEKDAAGTLPPDVQAKALQAFELYVAGEIIARTTEPAADAIGNVLADASLAVPGAPRFARLDELLAGEASAEQRAKLQAASVPVLTQLLPLMDARTKAIDGAVTSLGYPSAAEFGAQLRGTSLEGLAILAEKTLAATQDLYVKAMDKAALDELGLPLSKLRRGDLPRIFRKQSTDAAFPWTRTLPAAQALFAGLGLDLTKEPGLRLDIGPFEKKSPRAICIPVDVPGDVRVSVKPRPGDEALRETVFAFAEGVGNTRIKRPEWEFQVLGGRAKSEAIATALQDIVSSPVWLNAQSELKDPLKATLARRRAVERLYLLRRNAGLVLFGALRGQGRLNEPAIEAYRRIMSRAYGFALTADDAKRLSLDDDPFLDGADYLFGWILAAQVSKHLTAVDGERWWTSAKAGEELSALWARGTAVTAQDVAAWAGATEIDPAALVETLGAVPGVK